MRTNIENLTIYVVEKIREGQIDFDSYSGQHFLEWCEGHNYQNESFKIFARRFAMKPTLLEEMEKHSFRYRNFAKRFLVKDEQQDFLNYLLDQHTKFFGDQYDMEVGR